jgi:hypothetical protein
MIQVHCFGSLGSVLPACEPDLPQGTTGGNYYGLRAEIPILVK